MPKNKVSEWSSSPGNNTDVGGINIAEGCAPSNINNAIREVMAQIKDMQSGTDGDNFSVGGNLTVTGSATIVGGVNANVTGNLTGTASTATNALSLGGNLANTYAPLASPVFTGNPTAPTPVTSDNSTSVATTAYVTSKISAVSSGVVTLSGGTTGLTPATATAGAVTLGGTLNVANGGTGATTASDARTNLGATTVGSNMFTLTNPSAITFPRFNADNTVSALSAADFRTAIGATSGGGTVTSITAGSFLNGGTITTSGTISVNANANNVANSVVARDASGNFTASTITANLNGNASTATSASSATTASTATSATTATNIAGGGAGRIPYNTGTGATSFVAVGSADELLQSNGSAAPSWVSPSSLSVNYASTAGSATTASSATSSTTATNIAGGGAGRIPYNTGTGATAFTATGTSGQVLQSNGTSAPSWVTPTTITSDTVKTATGTSISFTGIPSTAKRITVLFNGVSLSGADDLLVQVGTAGGVVTTGYISRDAQAVNGGSGLGSSSTAGFVVTIGDLARECYGAMTIYLQTGNTYVSSHAVSSGGSRGGGGGGTVTLSGALSQVLIKASGSNSLDAGTINIMYE